MPPRSLIVLMWKHGTVRVRRFVHTIVEFASPLMLFAILFACKDILNPPLRSGLSYRDNQIHNTEAISLKDDVETPSILYYPDSANTNLLIDTAGKELMLHRGASVSDLRTDRTGHYYAFSNLSELYDYVDTLDSRNRPAVVIFHNMDGEVMPDKLNYTIRLYNNRILNYYQVETLGPHSQFGRDYEPFLKLQWAIDTSFISLKTGQNVSMDVSLQEFPYYRTEQNAGVELVCQVVLGIMAPSLIITFVFLTSRLLEERATGIQELIKMVGVSVHTLGLSHFLNVLPIGVLFAVVVTVLLKITSNPLIPNSNGFLIFLMLLLYFVSVVAVGFACSHLAKSTQYTSTIATFAYIALWLPVEFIAPNKSIPRPLLMLCGFLPHMPMYWFWIEVRDLEKFGGGVYWSTMWAHHSAQSCSVFMAIVFTLVQSAGFFFLAWYLTLVRPGQYGQALPWNFLIQNNYWTKNEVKPRAGSEEQEFIVRDPRYFENPPAGLDVGIKVANVSKVFGKNRALNNVSLDVYKGEITVLLGHNGAGKTTLMSIITGMYSATEGKVYVNGKDTETQMSEVRQHLGLCPQHNLFFPDLTLQEHIMFFTMLKRGSYSEATSSSLKLAKQLGLSEKMGVLCRVLSGGMKRRAQLACALAGGADLLILDEPTSGLDVETRRELWDLLLSLRGSRTVLLTTHFMEEADALGDRVAALHGGRLRCHATTMHLKKAIGTGYRLSFTTIGVPKESLITNTVTSHVPEATIKEKTLNSLSYNLPAIASNKFPKLFTALESKRSELGIDSIGVGVSTLEEVFLKLCSDVDTTMVEDEVDTAVVEPTINKLTGLPLYTRQLLVLLKRQVQYILYRKWSFLLLEAIIPIIMICVLTELFNMNDTIKDKSLTMDLDLYDTVQDKRVMYSVGGWDQPVEALRSRHKDVRFEDVDDIAEAVLRSGKKDIFEYNKYLVGIERNDTNAKVLFTTTVHHAAPVAMNLLTNMLAAQYNQFADGQTITTASYPFLRDSDAKIVQPKEQSATLLWAVAVIFTVVATYANLVSLPCKERESGARHVHIMCGCPAALHWAASLLTHLTVAAACLIVPLVLAALIIEREHTINRPDFLCALVLIMLLGTLSFFAFMYLVSFHFGERGSNVILVAALFLFGLVTPFLEAAYKFNAKLGSGGGSMLGYLVFTLCDALAPPHTFVSAAVRAGLAARLNALCDLNKHTCPKMAIYDTDFDVEKCCAGQLQSCYFCFGEDKPGPQMLLLFIQFIVYMGLVLLHQRGVMSYVKDFVFNKTYKPVAPQDGSEMVKAEKVYVSSAIKMTKAQIPDAMLADDLHKRYPRLLGKSCNAVRGVSFSVKKGECFGLLGVNGAGKSTTFKMLTTEECPTRGSIYSTGQHLSMFNTQYLQTLGYCPQFFGLDDFLTGNENLTLLLTLRGHQPDDVREEVDSWIRLVGLEKYSHAAVSGYSGGCTRRLAAAASLCVGAPVTLLDEPTAGVDVSARRRVWAALKRGLRNARAVVITSHSMDEMEALCARIGIMSAGQLRTLGSPAALRAAHAQGHAVIFKIRHASATGSYDEVDSVKSQTMLLKGKVHERFNCTLKDEHKTMLHYHINETMKYSDLFQQLEALKQEFGELVEDYSVTETTLEEVFLSFAKPPEET